MTVLDVRSLAVASRPRPSETEWRVANYSRIGTKYRTCTSGNDFLCELCAQNSGDLSRIIKVITIEHAYVVTTFQTLTRRSRWIPRFAKVNLNKGDIFDGIVLIQLSMYTFIVLTMRLCAQRNSCPKRTEWIEDLVHTHTSTHPNWAKNVESNHVTFLNCTETESEFKWQLFSV